jgi:hypothetical protein
VHEPTIWQVDLIASKKFDLPWPQSGFEFRAEFFNLFNRTTFRATFAAVIFVLTNIPSWSIFA